MEGKRRKKRGKQGKRGKRKDGGRNEGVEVDRDGGDASKEGEGKNERVQERMRRRGEEREGKERMREYKRE